MHVTYRDAVRNIAVSNWGKECSDLGVLERELIADPIKLAAYTIVDLISRLSPIKTMSSNETLGDPQNWNGTYPNAKIGDSMWEGSIEDGICEYIVLDKLATDHCVVCATGIGSDTPNAVHFASRGLSGSLREAVQNAALYDVDYHERYLIAARAALAAVDTDSDLSQYLMPGEMTNVGTD